jgi:hypothetical protein
MIGRSLDALGLRGVARRVESAVRPKVFRPDDKTTVEAVKRCLKMAEDAGLTREGDYMSLISTRICFSGAPSIS